MSENLNPNAFNFTAHRVREGQAKIVDRETMEVVAVPPKPQDVDKWIKEHKVATIKLVNPKGVEVKINADDSVEIKKWRDQGFMTEIELEELLRPSAEVEARKARLEAEAKAKAEAEEKAKADADDDGDDEDADEEETKSKSKGKKK